MKVLTRRQWAKRLSNNWRNVVNGTLTGIFKMGTDLIAAKESLEHGDFTAMIEKDLPFTPQWARKLMAVSRDTRLSKGKLTFLLPPHAETLYKLTRLDDVMLARLARNGTIHPTMGVNDMTKIVRMAKIRADERRVEKLGPIIGKFRTILIDPAWKDDWMSPSMQAKAGYAKQTLDELYALDVMAWADDVVGTHLYCCTTNNFIYEALKLVEHWGFQHKTVLTWVKPHFGQGSYFRNSTEHVLFATYGDTTTKHEAASIPTHFEAPRGDHSEKPEILYDIIRASSFAPYGEANQRQPREDFTNLFVPVNQLETA